MFDQLFFRSDALTRQLSTPLVDERRQYLTQCAAQGMSMGILRLKARLLVSIVEYLRLSARPARLLGIGPSVCRWRERRAQDVLMGFRPPISSNTPSHFGHWMMCDARRINSFG
jgi:hypothetical protein